VKQTKPKPVLSYAFVNAFLHDGVYNLMLFAQKRSLHSRYYIVVLLCNCDIVVVVNKTTTDSVAHIYEQSYGSMRSFFPFIAAVRRIIVL
jgi:hypothetical protein